MVINSAPIVRAFGLRHLKWYKEKYLVSVVFSKILEFEWFLIVMQKLEKKCQTLLDCLVPGCFNDVIKSTQIVASYNSKIVSV